MRKRKTDVARLIMIFAFVIWILLVTLFKIMEHRNNLGLFNLLNGNSVKLEGKDALIIITELLVLLLLALLVGQLKKNLEVKLTINNVRINVLFALPLLLLLISYSIYDLLGVYSRQLRITQMRSLLDDEKVVVHAAGEIYDGDVRYTYTNSKEALNNCYKAGNRVIEIDFLWSSDGKLICGHDSEEFALGIDSKVRLTEEEFLNQKYMGVYHTMNLDYLAQFMKEHSDMYVVTDIKENNVSGCQYIINHYPELTDRFIVQIYHYDEYKVISDMGFDYIILTIYGVYDEEKSVEKVLQCIQSKDILGFTMPYKYLNKAIWYDYGNRENLFDRVRETTVPVYLHTVDDKNDMVSDYNRGAAALYTNNVDNDWVR